MSTTKDFFVKAVNLLEITKEEQRKTIEKVAAMMGECMKENGIVQLFGIDHGRAFSMELGYRAGGLMPFHQFNTKDLALRGVISEEEYQREGFNDCEDMAEKLWDLYLVEPTDMFILVSLSGCEGLIIETALQAKQKGHKVVAVVTKELSDASISKHSSGKKLVEIADIVIDTGAKNPDLLLGVDGTHKVNQIATIAGNVIAQMITAEVYRYLKEQGTECPVLLSANIKGADVHNKELSDKYLGRWNA